MIEYFHFKWTSSSNIEFVEEGGFECMRENGNWKVKYRRLKGGPINGQFFRPIFNKIDQVKYEKAYQIYKREEKLKRILNI